MVETDGGPFDMRRFEPLKPCPIKPEILLRGIFAKQCTLFQSAMCPLKLDFYSLSQKEPFAIGGAGGQL
jgi:hypothetical protein